MGATKLIPWGLSEAPGLWRLKMGQFVALGLLALLVVAQFTWAGISLSSNAAESRQLLSQEADVSGLSFTQRESFTVLQRIDRWALDEVTARDVLIARANLARRLSVVTESGSGTFALTQPTYRIALRELDEFIEDIAALGTGDRVALRNNYAPVIASFDEETRALSGEFQKAFAKQAQESFDQRTSSEAVYLSLVIFSVVLFLVIIVWVGSDMTRTGLDFKRRLEEEEESLRRSRERLELLSRLERKGSAIARDINQGEDAQASQDKIVGLVEDLLPGDDVNLDTRFGWTSLSFSRTAASVDDQDREIIVARAEELFDQLSTRDKAEESFAHQASHDALTGLLNRVSFTQQLRQRVDSAASGGSALLIVALDIDRFGELNGAFGFEAGDLLLTSVADRLREGLGEDCAIARVAADEFVVLCDSASVENAQTRAREIHDLVQFSAEIQGTNSPISCSTAAFWVSGAEARTRDVYGQLGLVLKMAKDPNRESFIFFDPALHEGVGSNWVEDLELHGALQAQEFVLHYQPIIALATGQISGFECLIRWEKPGVGLVPPDDFLPGIERAGLTVELGREVIESAISAWKKSLHKVSQDTIAYVSINVDPRQLYDLGFADHVLTYARRLGVPPGAVVIEVTERDITEGPLANEQLRLLREGGIRVAIDDFGTGYSNLSLLNKSPVDMIKIDRTFLEAVDGSQESLGLISDVMQLAKRLQLVVIAEGIETLELKTRLLEIGVTHGQGFLFTKALPERELLAWAASRQVSGGK